MNMACYVLNQSPRAMLDGKVAEEVWTGKEVDYSFMRISGVQPTFIFPLKKGQSLIQNPRRVFFSGSRKE